MEITCRLVGGVVAIAMLAGVSSASADYTAMHSAGVVGGGESVGNVVFSGNADSDLLQIRRHTSGVLMHNRFGQADAGFASDLDFDTTLAGEQKLTNSASSTISANAGDGVDTLWSFESVPAIQVPVTFDGGDSIDTVDNFNSSGSAQTVTLNGNTINGVFASQLTYANVEFGIVRTAGSGSSNDTFDVTASPAAPTEILAGPGNDTLELANNTSIGRSFRGEQGTDTLDYSAWSAPVTANLGERAFFDASLDQAQENPPTASTATGTGYVFFTDTATNTFDYSLNVFGLTAAQITDSHIHSGAPGVNGPIIFPIGAGTGWTSPGGPSTNVSGQTDPDITEPALRDGNTYFNVHTGAHPNGEIRGRLELDPSAGYSGPATALGALGVGMMIENVIGGSGADTLTGNPLSNQLEGGPGDDTLNAVDGVADALLDCGAGTGDVLNRDPASIDADSVVSGCETVNPPLTPVLSGTDPASGSDDNTPLVKGSGPAGSTIDLHASNNCSGSPAVNDAPVASLAGAGVEVSVADNSTTQLSASATTGGGTSACSNSISYTEVTPPPGGADGGGGGSGGGGGGPTPTDTDPPETTVKKPKIKGDDVKLRFGSDELGSSFRCKLDKKKLKPCTSPKTYRNLDEGKHKILVVAIDPSGNVDPTPARKTVKVDE